LTHRAWRRATCAIRLHPRLCHPAAHFHPPAQLVNIFLLSRQLLFAVDREPLLREPVA
jgi:hypothetical protein